MAKTPTSNTRRARYPWEKRGEHDPDWQCIYCGRYMRDRRAIRAHKEGPWKVHACRSCDAVLAMARLDTLQGKQERVTDILKITDPSTLPPEHRVYVSREGLEIIDLRTGYVQVPWREYGETYEDGHHV